MAETNFPAINDPPRRMARETEKSTEMTSAKLRRYLRAQARIGNTGRLDEYRVALHSRYAFPLTCLMVIWIGLPMGMQVSRAGPLLSVGTALLLVGTFYFLSHITIA